MFFKGIFYLFPQPTVEEALALLETSQVADNVRDQCILSIKESLLDTREDENVLGGFCHSDEDFDVDDMIKFAYSDEDKKKSPRPGSIAQFLKYRYFDLPCPDSVLIILDEEKGIVITFDETGFRSSWWAGDFSSEYELFVVREE